MTLVINDHSDVCRFGLGKVHEQLQLEPPPQPMEDEGEGSGEGEGAPSPSGPEVGDITGFNRLDFTEWPYR